MAFNETRLPEEVERGAEGGPGFKTTVVNSFGGFEQRFANWSTVRGTWQLSYGIQTKTDFSTVRDAFYVQRAMLDGFRFKDWSDFELPDQQIALGDDSTTVFQVFKQYAFGAVTYDRDLRKIVAGTEVVRLDGVVKADPADYSIDDDTGLITMVVAPASTGGGGGGGEEILSVLCEFDVPVRFDMDDFVVTLSTFQAGAIPNVPIVELKLI